MKLRDLFWKLVIDVCDKKKVTDVMTTFLVTSNLTRPHQIQRGKADVANLWPNEMVVDQNQPGPVQPSKWAKPNNSVCLTFFSYQFFNDYMGQAQ